MAADFRDFVVFIPGIMGTRLWRDGRQLWGLSARTLVKLLATGARSLGALALPDDVRGPADDGITAAGMVEDLHVIPGLWSVGAGYGSFRRWLLRSLPLLEVGTTARAGNLLCFGYDWRLSNEWNAGRLKAAVEPALHAWRAESGHPARLVIIAHSMGGLIGRWYASKLDEENLTRLLVTVGTPHRGAVKALSAVGLGGRFPGPAHLRAVIRSFPSIYELMPGYACVDTESGLRTIGELAWETGNPHQRRAATFPAALDGAEVPCEFYAFVGLEQETATTLAESAGEYVTSPLIDGEWRGGDGTVAAFAARPTAWRGRDYRLRGVHDRHGSLLLNPWLRQELLRILTEDDRVFRAEPGVGVRLAIEAIGHEFVVRAESAPGRLLHAVWALADGGTPSSAVLREAEPGQYLATLGALPDGAYVLTLTPYGAPSQWRTHHPFFVVAGALLV